MGRSPKLGALNLSHNAQTPTMSSRAASPPPAGSQSPISTARTADNGARNDSAQSATAARILLRLREKIVRIRGPDATLASRGEQEADALFSIIAEMGTVLRGEQSEATLSAVDASMTPIAKVCVLLCLKSFCYLSSDHALNFFVGSLLSRLLSLVFFQNRTTRTFTARRESARSNRKTHTRDAGMLRRFSTCNPSCCGPPRG